MPKNPYVVNIDDVIPDVDKMETQKRCPALILVDCSGSMADSKNILQDSVQALYRQIMKDPSSSRAVELGIMSFNDKVTIHRHIKEIYRQADMGSDIDFVCENETLTGIAVREALRRIDKRRQDYVRCGIRSYAPVLMIISDGAPFVADPDDRAEEEKIREEVCIKIRNLVKDNHLIVLCVEVGRFCNHEIMQELTGTDNPKRVISHKSDKSISEEIANAFSFIAKLLVSQSNNGNFHSLFDEDKNNRNSNEKTETPERTEKNRNNRNSKRSRNNKNRNNQHNNPKNSEEDRKAREREIRERLKMIEKSLKNQFDNEDE